MNQSPQKNQQYEAINLNMVQNQTNKRGHRGLGVGQLNALVNASTESPLPAERMSAMGGKHPNKNRVMRLDGIQQSIELAHTIDDKLNTEYDHYLLNPKMSEPRAKPQQNDFVTGSIQNNNREQSSLGVKSQLVKKRND